MKKIAIVLLAFMVGTAAFTAQAKNPFLKFGVKVGISSEKQHAGNFPTTWQGLENVINSPSTGWHAGLVGRFKIPLIPVFVQGEFLYNWQTIQLRYDSSDTKVRSHYFSAPVLAGVSLGLGDLIRLRANLGPVFNFASKVTWDGSGYDDVLDGMFRKDTVGWSAGVGADVMGVTLDVRYNGQFKKDKADFHDINYRPTSWTISVGYLF